MTTDEELLQAIARALDEAKSWDVTVSRPPVPDTESPESIAANAAGWKAIKPGPMATITIRVRYDDEPLPPLPVPLPFCHS